MSIREPFPQPEPGLFYLTEGGTETEVMYRHGHSLREFAMFELIDKPAAVADLRDMYRRYLDVAAAHGWGAMLAGLDYRASPDWAGKLGITPDRLADMQHRCIDLLREVSAPYRDSVPAIVICGCIGPRGDAYALNRTITADEAEAYHATQIATLKAAKADLLWAATINNIPEAVGLSRAAARAGMPLTVNFTLDSTSRLRSGPSLREAIVATDAEAGDEAPDFYGINCSHPVEFEPALASAPATAEWIRRIRMIRPNASKMEKVALCKLGHIEEGDPVELGEQMGDLARSYPHMDIFGGCCGTWDKHFTEIVRAVGDARRLEPA